MELEDSNLNEQTVEVICGAIKGSFTDNIKETAVKQIIKEFKERGISAREVKQNVAFFKQQIDDFINNDLKPSAFKKEILDSLFEPIFEINNIAAQRYHSFDFELPIKLDEGAQMPTYAHDTDACADIYASKDITIPAHSLSNVIPTGLRIALSKGWVAKIVPRSSIGMKTGLRLSNSVGVIDADYRGEIGVLYDNFSDSDYEIKAGDRIAQMWVEPVYSFKPIEVSNLLDTERGSGGFGSTGK